jgi:putative thiamine transport system ATP-binding protein
MDDTVTNTGTTERSGRGLTLNQIDIRLKGEPVIALDAHVAPGEVLTVMGPSGSGKSTLLNLVAGFLPDAFEATGQVLLDGEDITHLPPEKRRLGLLFQDALLFPHLSVESNLLYALPPGGTRRTRCEKVRSFLDEMGMAELGARDPATLSGGQKARVALLRVLLAEPHALLLDEPFSRLDAERRAAVRAFVFDCARKRDLPVLLVTHDRDDAEAAGGAITLAE